VAGVARSTVTVAVAELEVPTGVTEGRSRRVGGGRKSAVEKDPGLVGALERLEGHPRGVADVVNANGLDASAVEERFGRAEHPRGRQVSSLRVALTPRRRDQYCP